MAQPPYEGVPQVEPSARPPEDFQHIQVPAQNAVAQGFQQLGAGATTAAKFYGEAAADNAANNYQDRVDKILHGDPSQMVPGPDGTMQPKPGFLALTGRSAMDAWPETSKQLDTIRNQIREDLTSPDQQLRFDNFTRRYKSYAVGQMGTHADRQSNTWYSEVNRDAGRLALEHIANNAENPEQVAGGASDLINARVKQVELAGAQKGDTVWNQTVTEARRDALEAQLNAIAVKDPARAMRMLDKNRNVAGTKYDNLANAYRARAEKQEGEEIGKDALRSTYEAVPPTERVYPVLNQIGAHYGVSGSYLQRTWEIEASGKFNPPDSSTGAKGPFQFTGTTARDMGVRNPRNFEEAADGAARLAFVNRAQLSRSLGRPPTDAELYLAHQQGADGAARLLLNPTVRAGDLVGDRAVAVNGGNPNLPASNFTQQWTQKFSGAGAAMSTSRKSAAYQVVAGRNDISEGVRDHAIVRINRDITMQTQAMEQTAAARRLASDAAADGYVTRLMRNEPVGVDELANDGHLTWETRLKLQQIVEHKSGNDVDAAAHAYGPGFWDAYKGVMAGENDPHRIVDVNHLLGLAGPESDPEHRLTLAGVDKLNQILTQSRKSVDNTSVERTKLGLFNYAKSKLSFEADTGPIKIRDPKGEALFNGTFIPQFEQGFDKWLKAGKDPYEYLNTKKIDEMVKGMRSQSEMAMDRMTALGEANPGDKTAAIPPAPQGIDAGAWARIMVKRPTTENGTQFAPGAWATAVGMLLEKPTPETIRLFNDSKFGKQGFKAEDILRELRPAPAAPASAPPAAAPAPVSDSGFRQGSVLDRVFTPHPASARVQGISPAARRREMEAEQAQEGAALVGGAP